MKTIKLTINPNEFKDRMFTTSEIGRGTGIHKAKKGKGSYNRKEKHKRQHDGYNNSGYAAFDFSVILALA